MNRFRIIPGSRTGTSGLISLTEDKRMEMSVKSRASQVITPTEKRIREIAFDRTAFEKLKKKTNPETGLQV